MAEGIRGMIQRGLLRLGYQVHKIGQPGWSLERPPVVPLWDEDLVFLRLFEEIKDRTIVPKERCFVLYQAVRQTLGLTGLLAEVGVYRGGTARLLALAQGEGPRTVHLFDTFAGMPATAAGRDHHRAGDFADTSLASVQAFLSDCPQVRLHPGFFPQTAAPVAQERFRLVHLDVDIYQSFRDCLDFFYPRLAPGGLIVCDDYGSWSCPGARQAVDKFLADKPETLFYLPTGQGLIIKH